MVTESKQKTTKNSSTVKPKAGTSSTPVPDVIDVVLDHPLSVTASYATMTNVMCSPDAVRISFGEASPTGNRFHTAVALGYGSAKLLLESLQDVVARYERGDLQSVEVSHVDG